MFHAHAKREALPYDVMIFYGLFVRASGTSDELHDVYRLLT
jgi:hypothetical protein